MSREFPDRVDPWKAADGNKTFSGTMPLKRMKRLTPLLAPVGDSDRGEAGFSARFQRDEQAQVRIMIEVKANLSLICQRSLTEYSERVHRRSVLGVIEELTEQELLPGNYEPILVENGRLELLDLVEDELLLGLPQIPRNPAVAEVELSAGELPEPSPGEQTGRRQKPFAGLAGMLKDDQNI
jgi:uncharacterized protein